MAAEKNVKMIAGPQPTATPEVHISVRQRSLGVEIVAQRGDAESVLLSINNRFHVMLSENVDARLGFPRTAGNKMILIDHDSLPQPAK